MKRLQIILLFLVTLLCATPANAQVTSGKTSEPTTGSINGHEWVDLGLSVKWATCNMGANSPWDYGDYYAWGETNTKSDFTADNSVTYAKNMATIDSIAGNPTYDAARASWGGTWRLPTREEIDELVKCKRKWTTKGGHKGYKITGPNGNSIFLPAAGWRGGTSLYEAGVHGYYWSAMPDENDTSIAYALYFFRGYFCGHWNYRHYGLSVRPVCD